VITIALDAASVARIRVAPSPVFEVASWLALTARGGRHPVFGDPGATARFALRDRDVATAAAVLLRAERYRYVPDFLVPKPGVGSITAVLEDQVDQVRGTPPASARDQTVILWGCQEDEFSRFWGEDPGGAVAGGLVKFARSALSEAWPDIELKLAEHVRTSVEAATAGGMAAVLNSAHPGIAWDGSCLTVEKSRQGHFELAGDELVLSPALLTSTEITVQLDDATDAYVTFRCPSASLNRRRAGTPASLLGRGRASVFTRLQRPSTTREVARDVGLSESTVSHHLHRLQDAGLVRGRRRGQRVEYALTPDGRRLLSATG
jgi:DNA-binding transcriptional ArsR family regulator